MNRVLKIQRGNALTKRVLLRAARIELIHVAQKKIRQRIARKRSVELEVAILQVTGEIVILASDKIDPEHHLVIATDQVDVICKLPCICVVLFFKQKTAYDIEVITDFHADIIGNSVV